MAGTYKVPNMCFVSSSFLWHNSHSDRNGRGLSQYLLSSRCSQEEGSEVMSGTEGNTAVID